MSPKIERRGTSLSFVVLLTCGLLLVGVTFGNLLTARETEQEKKTYKTGGTEVFNAEFAKLKNPEKDSPENVKAGREVYQLNCASCHGKTGNGDGGDNRGGTTIPNLIDDEWIFGATDGEIFMAIKEGTGSPDMQPYKDVIDEKEMWQSIVFIRSIAEKPRAGGGGRGAAKGAEKDKAD